MSLRKRSLVRTWLDSLKDMFVLCCMLLSDVQFNGILMMILGISVIVFVVVVVLLLVFFVNIDVT